MTDLQRVIAVATGKGGTGKTSVTANVAGLAAAAGWNTLVIDLDSQGNLGHDLGYGWDGSTDDGAGLLQTLITGDELKPVLKGVRQNLDVIPGGAELDTLEDVLMSEAHRGGPGPARLRNALARTRGEYDLILIDTPPSRRSAMVLMALVAARWIIIPSKSDRSSIEGLRMLGDQIELARGQNPDLEVLGAVLFDVGSTSHVLRRHALEDMNTVLAGAAPVFESVIRHTESAADSAREAGRLIHELAEVVYNAEPFWKALKEGRSPNRVPGTAPALAEDYALLTQEVLERISAAEAGIETKAGVSA